MLKEILKERDLLPVVTMNDGTPATPETWEQRRTEMREALEIYSYGHTLPKPTRVWGEVVAKEEVAYANKATQEKLAISFETERGVFTFPCWLFRPKKVEKPRVILNIHFRYGMPTDMPPIHRVPVEDILDNGYALLSLAYSDVVNDRLHGDYSDGLAAYFGVTTDRGPEEWGKIGLWAYACSRTLDYLLTRDDLDAEHTTVVGHSRLGKTALWTGAQDERFWCTISNNSGYGGAATSKHGNGERVTDFLYHGSWDWYCENFKLFAGDKEDFKPYDQAWLLALVAPRYLCVGSAIEDHCADPESEFLTTLWASQAWELLGETGLVTPDRLPVPGDQLFEGKVGYHLRAGSHFFACEDWRAYLRFLNSKK
ncbi:MAG: hypothetical protein J6K62_07700 [Clostridia bacterium]|nr:hypothetical protein [Clostridia bacterium]